MCSFYDIWNEHMLLCLLQYDVTSDTNKTKRELEAKQIEIFAITSNRTLNKKDSCVHIHCWCNLMKAQVIYKAKTIITTDFKHVLFVYFIILFKRWCSDFVHIAATMLRIITQHLVHVLHQWPKRDASGLWFVRVTLNANVGAVVVITCSVCMHLKRQGNCGNSRWYQSVHTPCSAYCINGK